MSVTREELMKECGQEPPTPKPPYDPYKNNKADMEAAMQDLQAYHGLGSSNNCPRCGGSLCVEEWHDCESDRAWRAAH